MSDAVILALLAGTLQVSLALIAAIVAVFTYRKTNETHQLVNGMTAEKDKALQDAARKEGELVGRDFKPG